MSGGQKRIRAQGASVIGCDLQALALVFDEGLDAVTAWTDRGVSTSGSGFLLAYANPAAEALFGQAMRQLIGQDLAQILPEAVSAGLAQRFADLRVNGRPIRFELPFGGDKAALGLEFTLQAVGQALLCTARPGAGEIRIAPSPAMAMEQRHQAAAEQGVLIGRFLPDTTYTFVNSALAEANGRLPEDMVGRRFIDFIPLPYHAPMLQGLAACAPEQPYFVCEHPVMIASGETRWQRWTNRANFDAKRRLTDFSSLGHDITAFKQAEIERDETRRRLNIILDRSPVGILYTNDRGRVTHVNRRPLELLGMSEADFLAGLWRERLIEPSKERLTEITRANNLKGEPWSISGRMIGAGGRELWLYLQFTPEKDEAGLVKAWIGTLTDLSSQMQAARRLAESEQRYNSLCSSAPVGIFQTDGSGRIVYVNERYAELTGLTLEAAQRVRQFSNHPEPHRSRLLDAWRRQRDAGSAESLELQYRHPATGAIRWLFCQSTPLRGDRDQLLGFVGTVTDITQQKQAEDAMRVALETAELANRSKSQFLATMSHELRTPLNAIIGFSELLQGGGVGQLNAKQREYLSDIVASGQHLQNLISDLLDIAKIESGQHRPCLEETDIDYVCRAAERMLCEKAAENGVGLRRMGLGELPAVTLDLRMFKQVLLNLLSNAIRHTPPGGMVSVLGRLAKDGVHISVCDTGCGIPPNELPKLTQPFYQVDSNVTRSSNGAGLGLFIVRKLVEAHGGFITLSSEVGRGTMVDIVLPHSLVAQSGVRVN